MIHRSAGLRHGAFLTPYAPTSERRPPARRILDPIRTNIGAPASGTASLRCPLKQQTGPETPTRGVISPAVCDRRQRRSAAGTARIEGQVQRGVLVHVLWNVAVKQVTPSPTMRRKPAELLKTIDQAPLRTCPSVPAHLPNSDAGASEFGKAVGGGIACGCEGGSGCGCPHCLHKTVPDDPTTLAVTTLIMAPNCRIVAGYSRDTTKI